MGNEGMGEWGIGNEGMGNWEWGNEEIVQPVRLVSNYFEKI